MYQGPTQAISALESGGNLERILTTLSQSHTDLLREILVELRVHSGVLQDGLNTTEDPEALREDIRSDTLGPIPAS